LSGRQDVVYRVARPENRRGSGANRLFLEDALMWIRDWTSRHLVISWLVYWAGLVAVVAGRPLLEYLRLQTTDGHGEVGFSYSGSLFTLALWIAGPPLLLFLAWLTMRPRVPTDQNSEQTPVSKSDSRPVA
jgi:hypothetical protein